MSGTQLCTRTGEGRRERKRHRDRTSEREEDEYREATNIRLVSEIGDKGGRICLFEMIRGKEKRVLSTKAEKERKIQPETDRLHGFLAETTFHGLQKLNKTNGT